MMMSYLSNYLCIFTGTILLLLAVSNKTKRAQRNEKTGEGKVLSFGLLDEGKFYPMKYRAIVKSGMKKYEIDYYTMPWLVEGEKVKIQITGKQKVLGNDRLNNRSKVEFLFGFILILVPFVVFLA